jgi:hypothetical protein
MYVFPAILLIIQVIGVISWIGGVAFVTMVVFPMMSRTATEKPRGAIPGRRMDRKDIWI